LARKETISCLLSQKKKKHRFFQTKQTTVKDYQLTQQQNGVVDIEEVVEEEVTRRSRYRNIKSR
jgi:hypothetical protein